MIIDKLIGDKRRWRQYKSRIRELPENYRAAVEALERYLMHLGPADGESAMKMFEDLADLFERAAADATPIREIVGENPVEFIEAFAANYRKGGWVTREQERLLNAIDRVADDRPGSEGDSR